MRSRFRMSTFDLGIFLMVLITVWVAISSYQTSRQLATRRAKFNATQGIVQTLEVAKPLDGGRLRDIFAMKDLADLRQEYLSMAEQAQQHVDGLQQSLHEFAAMKKRDSFKRFQNKSQQFTLWVQNQERQIDPLKHRQLSAWLSENQPAVTNAGALADTPGLLATMATTLTQYLAHADYAGKHAGLPFTRDQVNQHLRSADSTADQIRELANQLRTKGQMIDSVWEAHSTRLTQGEKVSVQDSGQQWLTWLAQLESRSQRVLLASSLAVVGLCILLTIAIYRRAEAPDQAKTERQRILTQFGTFASGLAHEIRNPLTAINARLHALQKSLVVGSAEHKDATLIRNEISRLDQIVKEFLLLARPAEPKLATVTAEPILQEVKELLEPQCTKRGVALILESAVPTRFLADAQQLKQVLINLIQNAADSIEGKGTVTLRAREDKIWLATGPMEAVEIDVEDTGSGIPLEVKEKIFQPFFSTKEHGTGLGLPISARIVEQHGGRLEFDSHNGQGTVFRILLPTYN